MTESDREDMAEPEIEHSLSEDEVCRETDKASRSKVHSLCADVKSGDLVHLKGQRPKKRCVFLA